MITNITLNDFKCFQDISIDPKLVTVLIGPNGTGKSGILQALLLLKQSKDPSKKLDLDGHYLPFAEEEFMNHLARRQQAMVCLSLSGYWDVARADVDSPVRFSVRPPIRSKSRFYSWQNWAD